MGSVKAINWKTWVEDQVHKMQLEWVCADQDADERQRGEYEAYKEVQNIFKSVLFNVNNDTLKLIDMVILSSAKVLNTLNFDLKAQNLPYFEGRLEGFKKISIKIREELENVG